MGCKTLNLGKILTLHVLYHTVLGAPPLLAECKLFSHQLRVNEMLRSHWTWSKLCTKNENLSLVNQERVWGTLHFRGPSLGLWNPFFFLNSGDFCGPVKCSLKQCYMQFPFSFSTSVSINQLVETQKSFSLPTISYLTASQRDLASAVFPLSGVK